MAGREAERLERAAEVRPSTSSFPQLRPDLVGHRPPFHQGLAEELRARGEAGAEVGAVQRLLKAYRASAGRLRAAAREHDRWEVAAPGLEGLSEEELGARVEEAKATIQTLDAVLKRLLERAYWVMLTIKQLRLPDATQETD